jgi:hypothetical protein
VPAGGPVSPYEDLPVLVIEGWTEGAAAPADPTMSVAP